ncbi:unnamed protein product, partial [Didymodactylos carnosus]
MYSAPPGNMSVPLVTARGCRDKNVNGP